MSKDENEKAKRALIEQTQREVVTAWDDLIKLEAKNREVFMRFGELADTLNSALEAHKKVLKSLGADSDVLKMSKAPETYKCTDVAQAIELLGDRFTEYFKIEARTEIVRNALDAGTVSGLEMVVAKSYGEPRHGGMQPINIKALTWNPKRRELISQKLELEDGHEPAKG